MTIYSYLHYVTHNDQNPKNPEPLIFHPSSLLLPSCFMLIFILAALANLPEHQSFSGGDARQVCQSI